MESINYGVIEGQRDTDYAAGVLPYEERNPSGDWTAYLPLGEWQNGSIDTMACVTFSALNSLEAQYKFLTNKERNFSDRFTAKMSGTGPNGNYLWKVADSIRHDGLADEADWPKPETFTWDSYYTTPPIEVINKASLFKNDFSVQYEWIDTTKESLLYHLKHAPIQVVIPGHAVLAFYKNDDVLKYFDSYAPFIKERTEGISSAMKIVLSKGKSIMTETEVKATQLLEGYQDSDGQKFWAGKELKQYLIARLEDKIKQEQSVLTELKNG